MSLQEMFIDMSETLPNFDGPSFFFGAVCLMVFNFEFVLLYHFIPWALRCFWETLVSVVKYITRKKQDP